MKTNKKKKQHYVPQCYLESWRIPNTNQIFTFDKKKVEVRKNNISDVASENYFYDIDFLGVLTVEDLEKYGLKGYDPSKLDESQYIENFFSEQIEGNYKALLNKIIDRTQKMNLWERNNCFFISEKDKLKLSIHLAFQYIRVKSTRNSIFDSSDCLKQVLNDMGVPSETIKKYCITKSELPYIHGKMFLDSEVMGEMAQCFNRLSWILLFNKTNQSFYTSDNPIWSVPHVKHPFLSMSGIRSKGVEIDFPISPNLMLVMVDGDYHTTLQKYDRRIFDINNAEDIKENNVISFMHCDRCVYSIDNNFSDIQDAIKENPDILNIPHTVVEWGGKTYTPKG